MSSPQLAKWLRRSTLSLGVSVGGDGVDAGAHRKANYLLRSDWGRRVRPSAKFERGERERERRDFGGSDAALPCPGSTAFL